MEIPMTQKTVMVSVELTDEEAWAFAQYLKRVGFYDYKSNSENEEQTYLMRDAGFKVQKALADVGYAPR